MLNVHQLLAPAAANQELFRARAAGIERSWKGVRPSEMFFVFAALCESPPRRVLESGRAQGFSTLVLARCFPHAQIISIESDADSPDAQVAAERLKDCANVDCRFGDARTMLPQLVENDDAILIDGPKDFRALKLTLQLLRTGKPRAVFVHDVPLGTPSRSFLDKHVPSAFFSDEPAFRWLYSYLDSDAQPPLGSMPPGFLRVSYGATMGCIPAPVSRCDRLLRLATFAQWREKLRDHVRKLQQRRDLNKTPAEVVSSPL